MRVRLTMRAAGLLAVLLALVVTAALAGRLRPAQILAVSCCGRSGTTDVLLVDAQTGAQVNLTRTDAIDERELDVSVDGAIAFVRVGAVEQEVCIIRPAQAERCLTDLGDGQAAPRWSPDGRELLITVLGQAGVSTLFIVSPETGRRTPLPSTGGSALQAQWSPDGQRIAVSSTTPMQSLLVVLDADGGPPRVLTNALRAYGWPRWSPDGRVLAFIDVHDRLALIGAEGGSVQTLTAHGIVHSLTWSPDGQAIAFAVDVDGQRDVVIRRLPDGQQQNISHGAGVATMPVWSPDGAMIAYILEIDHWGFRQKWLALYDIASGDTRRVLPISWSDVSAPAWSPDGTMIARILEIDHLGFRQKWLALYDIASGETRHVIPLGWADAGTPAWPGGA